MRNRSELDQILLIGANNPETIRMIRAVNRVSPVNFIGFIDNDPLKKGIDFYGLPVHGGFECLSAFDPESVAFVNLITRDCATRFETSRSVSSMGFEFVNLMHPSVDLSLVKIGKGNYVQEGVILQAEVELGHNSSIHMGSLIGHESKIGSSVFVAHGVVMSGCVIVHDGAFIGAGATILPRITIGRWSVIGAGAVITRDVEPGAVVVGNPGRVIKMKEIKSVEGNPFV